MSSLGIGLGAFMGGFTKGYGLGNDIKDRKRTNKLQAEADESTAKLKAIETDTQAEFDQGVASGTQQPDKFDEFWLKYALPKRKMEMLKQGDVAGAKQLMDWGQSEETLKGGRLFGSALFKAQTGDTEGAFNDAIKAGQLKGYIDHGYSLEGKDDLQQDGKTIGFRVRLKGPDGNISSQDIPIGQLGTAISTLLSPDAAIAQNAATRSAAAKREQELEDYSTKKQIDQKYAPDKKDPNAESYGKVQADFMKNDLDFASLSAEEQDKKVRAALTQADVYSQEKSGATGLGGSNRPAPPQRNIIDTQTGKPVQAPPQAAPAQQPIGLGQAPAPEQAAAVAPSPVAPAAQSPVAPAQKQIDPAQAKAMMIKDAADYMVQGGNPNQIAQQLLNAGIRPEEWPLELQQAVQRAQAQQAPGLPQ